MLKKEHIYIGNIYLVTDIKIIRHDKKNYFEDEFPLTSINVIPETIDVKPIYEVYKEDAILIKQEDNPISKYIDLDTNMKLSSFPLGAATLMVIPDELRSYYDLKEKGTRISKRQLVKEINRKN